MALVDTVSVPGGSGQLITDWANGDDRQFTGAVAGLPASDNTLTDAYFTLKRSPTDDDSLAIVQKHITTALTAFWANYDR